MKATITKTQDAQPVGHYVRTSVDDAKGAADILITGHSRSRTEIRTRRLLSGSGVKMIASHNGTAVYHVTDTVLTELRRRFSVATDF